MATSVYLDFINEIRQRMADILQLSNYCLSKFPVEQNSTTEKNQNLIQKFREANDEILKVMDHLKMLTEFINGGLVIQEGTAVKKPELLNFKNQIWHLLNMGLFGYPILKKHQFYLSQDLEEIPVREISDDIILNFLQGLQRLAKEFGTSEKQNFHVEFVHENFIFLNNTLNDSSVHMAQV